jgi:hypothetical protein
MATMHDDDSPWKVWGWGCAHATLTDLKQHVQARGIDADLPHDV